MNLEVFELVAKLMLANAGVVILMVVLSYAMSALFLRGLQLLDDRLSPSSETNASQPLERDRSSGPSA